MYTCVRVYAKISGSTHVHERVYYIIIMQASLHVCVCVYDCV